MSAPSPHPTAEPVRRCKHDVSEDCPACAEEKIAGLKAELAQQRQDGIESNRLAADNFKRAKIAEAALRDERKRTIEECALVAEGFDASCNSERMKLFVEAGLVIAIYKRDGEIGQAIRALPQSSTPAVSR